jgi:GH15 family glucan-1,4-alpha-glucosidase
MSYIGSPDSRIGAFLGNLPQGLSHLALLNAAALLDEQQGG